MGNTLSRLEQHQAVTGIRAVEAATGDIIHECPVVIDRVVPAQAQFEALPPGLSTVTRSRIAADLRHDRFDIANEVGLARRDVFHIHGHLDRVASR